MTASSSVPLAAPSTERYHAIDALRALAMFLGVVLHASLSFMVAAVPFTPRQDLSRWAGFDIGVTLIHVFRMQLFFLVAGIFTALILSRRTPREFIAGRMKRIVVPLLGAAVVLVPLTVAPFLLAHGLGYFPDGWPRIYWSTPGQFWFLICLTVFSTAALVPVMLRRLTRLSARPLLLWLGGLPERWWGMALLVIAAALLTLTMPRVIVETPGRWMPDPRTLAYYGFFFLIGCAVQLRGTVPSLGRGWWWMLPATLVVAAPIFIVVVAAASVDANSRGGASAEGAASIAIALKCLGSLVQSICTWGLVLGLFGLFGRVFAHVRPWVRWLADSSYWVYLVHLPVVYAMAYWLSDRTLLGMANGPAQAIVKFTLVLTAATFVSLASYALFVRPTVLERFVGGMSRRLRAMSD